MARVLPERRHAARRRRGTRASASGPSAPGAPTSPSGSPAATDRVGRFDATGERIVVRHRRRKVAVRELATGREIDARRGRAQATSAPRGQPRRTSTSLVLPERDVLLYRQPTGPSAPERVLEGHDGRCSRIRLQRRRPAGDRRRRPDGPRLGSDGGQSAVLRGHEDELTSVVFTRGRHAGAHLQQDGTLRLLDARDGRPSSRCCSRRRASCTDVALSADGKIATLGEGDVVRVFACEVCGSLDEVRALARSRSPDPLTADERREYLAAAG